MDEVITIQRVLKHNGVTCTPEDVSIIKNRRNGTVSYAVGQVEHVWKYVYRGHFLQETQQVIGKCQRGFLLRQYDAKVRISSQFCYIAQKELLNHMSENFGKDKLRK